ncbi:hypothetical protein ACM40_17040 [Chryseobacterium sp. BLS98]|jgi:hypothetical protein|uniref:hypothetical protein n=1 Tax=Chryseobacterium sp. BLS98 TaxID=885586 RepID=UPI00065AD3E9|nr:hypothetical protein [Chryseobacterium sp. BLS98]KMQ59815.1 hypothetical protein ACM40_17040 [Chryseobacterium sp. BLS98]
MKILLFPLFLIPVALSAQKEDQKQPMLKKDTAKIFNFKRIGDTKAKTDTDKKELYKILTVKPKDTAAYIALKQSEKKDYSKYKILNPGMPEKTQEDTKKAQPSK